jgi:hypothetical protein
MAGNVYELRTQERAVNAASDNERAGLTALTLADGGVPDDFSLYTALAGRFPRSDVIEKLPSFALDETLAAYGSPAYSLGELASRPESVRLNADYVSLQGTGSGLRPSPALPPARSPAPRALSVIHGDWATGPTGCLTLRPSGGTAAGTLSLPSDGLTLAVGSGPPATVTAGRVADGTPLPMGTVPGDQKAIVHLATGRAPQPWRVGIRAEQSVLACNP